MADKIKDLQQQVKVRLNEKDPQFPPDTYYIKNNVGILEEMIHDPAKSHRVMVRATPRQAHRFQLFKVQQEDLDELKKRDTVDMSVSKKDPWQERMQNGRVQDFKPMHSGVLKTDDILDKFSI